MRLFTGHWRKTICIYRTFLLKTALRSCVALSNSCVYILFLWCVRPSFWYFCSCTCILILLCSFILFLLKSRVYFEVPVFIQEIFKRFFFFLVKMCFISLSLFAMNENLVAYDFYLPLYVSHCVIVRNLFSMFLFLSKAAREVTLQLTHQIIFNISFLHLRNT